MSEIFARSKSYSFDELEMALKCSAEVAAEFRSVERYVDAFTSCLPFRSTKGTLQCKKSAPSKGRVMLPTIKFHR